ncbi:hypothetical protein [Mucilaginibacter sp.]|uniref:hypothetical protein n=1 Tax=Mucilaginibacter sp. TaxID=1882438 RepID=UPI00262B3BBA|nr:hypothetical protein [Mucilaginibacter sp.]MDB4919099.1 hypothetical protein [Mucilaginibacter sp.]
MEVTSEINYKKQLLARFELLLEHYDSDLSRLEFIDEGSNLFSLLNYAACPVCGTEIEEQHYKCIRNNEVQSEMLTEAISSGFTKIQEKTIDLKQTINDITSTVREHERVLAKVIDEIKHFDNYIEQEVM